MSFQFKLLLAVYCTFLPLAHSAENFKRSVKLAEFYEMDWEVDFFKETITFEVRVKTSGYVGFGLNHNGGMMGADIVIGGVNADCGSYFTDRHGIGFVEPVVDASQDWFLSCASETWENDGPLTSLTFSRKFFTCDADDLPITNDTMYVIFSMGATDEIRYHGPNNRGSRALNLLDPPSPPPADPSQALKWEIAVNTRLPDGQNTVYWCSVHKAPKFSQKIHITGFEAILNSADALHYVHHMMLHRCVTLPGVNLPSLMEPYLYPAHPGGQCYVDPAILRIYSNCGIYAVGWARGADPVFFPDHVGMPIGDNPGGGDDYFMLEIHYDNPSIDAGVQFLTGMNVYYTLELRQYDAGLLVVGSQPNPTLLVPPNQQEFVVTGHCSPPCTERTFPEDGINIFSVLLHAHLSARKMKLRHFRDSQELPWVAYDNYYDFNYQQNRPTRDEVHVQKGDQLTMECTYNSAWKGDGTVVVGGYSTREEMCDAFIFYYPLMRDLDACVSGPGPIQEIFNMFGLTVQADILTPPYNFVVQEPESLKGMRYEDALNTYVDWSTELIETYRERSRFGPHFQLCIAYRLPLEDQIVLPPTATYPQGLIEYAPEDECQDPGREPFHPEHRICPCCQASSMFAAHSNVYNFSYIN